MLWNGSTICSAKRALIGRLAFGFLLVSVALVATRSGETQTAATDPGVRGGPAGAGGPIVGLTESQKAFFMSGLAEFLQLDSVKGTISNTGGGLGPRFNAESCGQCHAQPAVGGTSPATNPQITAATDQGARNLIPFFLASNGPVREARFPYQSDLRTPDGGVHDLFTITGRNDAQGCSLVQPDFQGAANNGNLIFRIPTPVFGAGLIESIPDSAILNNIRANSTIKRGWGIGGHPNYRAGLVAANGFPNTSGNDGTITRFGWKAQNKSMAVFAGEAYNVEMGVTNELFPTERDETPGCLFNTTPEDLNTMDDSGNVQASDIVKFTAFMRFLDQPQPAAPSASTARGSQVFTQVGCSLCHTASFTTGQSSIAALSNVRVNVFSDLVLHHMGPRLADNVSQGAAAGDEFRTAPLWGLGQRIFFLHDGRTADLVRAIMAHSSYGDGHYPDSEANTVIENYKKLSVQNQQDLLNFLRSL